jgi:hypothetical protein
MSLDMIPGTGRGVSSGYRIYEVTSVRPACQNELPVGREQSIAGAFQCHRLRHPVEFLHVEARALPGFIAGHQHSLAVVKPLSVRVMFEIARFELPRLTGAGGVDKEFGQMAKKQSGKGKRHVPKTVSRLPDLDQAKSAVLNSLSSIDAQRGHRHAIEEFVEWYCSEPRLSFSKTVVLRYRIHLESRHLAPGTINLRLGAVRRLADEASDCGLLSSDPAAGIRRVKGVKKIDVRLGNWLTPEQSQRLSNTPDSQLLKGKRDRAHLAVLLACGLRRPPLYEQAA